MSPRYSSWPSFLAEARLVDFIRQSAQTVEKTSCSLCTVEVNRAHIPNHSENVCEGGIRKYTIKLIT